MQAARKQVGTLLPTATSLPVSVHAPPPRMHAPAQVLAVLLRRSKGLEDGVGCVAAQRSQQRCRAQQADLAAANQQLCRLHRHGQAAQKAPQRGGLEAAGVGRWRCGAGAGKVEQCICKRATNTGAAVPLVEHCHASDDAAAQHQTSRPPSCLPLSCTCANGAAQLPDAWRLHMRRPHRRAPRCRVASCSGAAGPAGCSSAGWTRTAGPASRACRHQGTHLLGKPPWQLRAGTMAGRTPGMLAPAGLCNAAACKLASGAGE